MPFLSPKRRVSDAENKLRLLLCLRALGMATSDQLWPFVAGLELMEYLLERAQAYEASIERNTQQLQRFPMPRMKEREFLQDIQRNRRLLRRLQRNMEYLEVV